MPRKPSYPHVLRTARIIHELTQQQLAKRVGVAVITLQKIESGQIKLSKRLANRLSIATGVDPAQLIENFEPEKPYLNVISFRSPTPPRIPLKNSRALQLIKENKPSKDSMETELRLIQDSLRQMLEASIPKGSYWVLLHAISWALSDLREEFKLPPKVQAARKRVPPQASPGSGSAERRSAILQRVPSVRQSRRHV